MENPKDKSKFQSKSEKALYGIYLLTEEGKNPITVEDLAVKLWALYDKEFCMKGYPQFPNVDIQKYLTKLFTSNMIKGGVVNYKITSKGIQTVKSIIDFNKNEEKNLSESDASISRELRAEISRILNSKVYKYFINEEHPDFLELDFFEFLGTSPRTLHDKRNSNFLSKINLIRNDLVQYCKKNSSKDKDLKNILELWNILEPKFGGILK